MCLCFNISGEWSLLVKAKAVCGKLYNETQLRQPGQLRQLGQVVRPVKQVRKLRQVKTDEAVETVTILVRQSRHLTQSVLHLDRFLRAPPVRMDGNPLNSRHVARTTSTFLIFSLQ